MEAKLVPAEGFDLELIRIGGLNRVGLRQKLATVLQLPFAAIQCSRFLSGHRPPATGHRSPASAVFSMGGYVAGPPVMAALIRRVPVVVMEPNAVPGFTNRVIGRFVSRALISFPETAAYFAKGRTEITGLPVREEFFQIAPKPRGPVLHILITGGSQGSRTLNEAARQSWSVFRQSGLAVSIVHQTGLAGFDSIRDGFAKSGVPGEIVPFIHDMPAAFAAADLVICRSGAGAVSELAAAGKPAILVPFPFAADDHQTRNAEALERGGAARLVRDAEFTGQRLFATVQDLSPSLERMAASARQFAKPGAAARAAQILEEVAGV
jgi:UDP-N-acetylglucosamine--N-acetylmuramyl-(pentapeptide) pyrophosphoryl-undecaprenol N-acetylglucosamine transferase